MSSGERPIGAAKGKHPCTEALCQNPQHKLIQTGSEIQPINQPLFALCHFSISTAMLWRHPPPPRRPHPTDRTVMWGGVGSVVQPVSSIVSAV